METIFELFAAINTAIDAGVMTPEVIAFAALAISHRVFTDWKVGIVNEEQLRRISQEMEHLNQHWKSFQLGQTSGGHLSPFMNVASARFSSRQSSAALTASIQPSTAWP
jgi:hypothetical protein